MKPPSYRSLLGSAFATLAVAGVLLMALPASADVIPTYGAAQGSGNPLSISLPVTNGDIVALVCGAAAGVSLGTPSPSGNHDGGFTNQVTKVFTDGLGNVEQGWGWTATASATATDSISISWTLAASTDFCIAYDLSGYTLTGLTTLTAAADSSTASVASTSFSEMAVVGMVVGASDGANAGYPTTAQSPFAQIYRTDTITRLFGFVSAGYTGTTTASFTNANNLGGHWAEFLMAIPQVGTTATTTTTVTTTATTTTTATVTTTHTVNTTTTATTTTTVTTTQTNHTTVTSTSTETTTSTSYTSTDTTITSTAADFTDISYILLAFGILGACVFAAGSVFHKLPGRRD